MAKRNPPPPPHPIQTRLWKKFAAVKPGVFVESIGTTGEPDEDGVSVGIRISGLSEAEAEAVLAAAAVILARHR